MRASFSKLVWIGVASTLLFFVGGCEPNTIFDAPPDAVSVQLKWVHQGQFAGFYVALEEGYYAEENLNVTLLPGGGGIDVYQSLADGSADFSVVGADSLFVQRSNGIEAKAIATTYRINPFALATLADSGIRTPADFVGKRVSITGMFDEVQFIAMLNQFDLSMDDIERIPYDPNNQDALLAGDVDVIGTFLAGAFIGLQQSAGDREIHLILPGDFGVHFYSDTIIVLDSLIDENPDLVLRFLRATLKGHQTAIEDPQRALQATMRYAVVQDEALQTEMIRASAPLIHTGINHIGWMRESVWQDTQQVLLDEGVIDALFALDDIYTMQFLQAIYGGDG